MTANKSPWALMQPRVITVGGDRVAYRTAGEGLVLVDFIASTKPARLPVRSPRRRSDLHR